MSTNLQNCTITVRVIRSLEHKNWKPLVIRNCDLTTWTLADLKRIVQERLQDPGCGFPPPYTRDLAYYDSVKLETDPKANNAKSANALINDRTKTIEFTLTSPESSLSLSSLGLSHECEVSCFNSKDYENYLKNRAF